MQNSTGFILVSANGGLNQQRVAVCNAVAVASLLNATLVIPKFLYSNVWADPSQFGDIYQEEYFMHALKDEVNIGKELPPHLKLIEFEAIGSLITDADITKEATPSEYIKKILHILLHNGVVHFLGYGNRLGFDPLPFELQKLRCKCNFHALKFVPKIQETGSLLLRRLRKYDIKKNMLDKQLLGKFMPNVPLKWRSNKKSPSKYVALHLRFEVDMVAYSLCEFGGGETERRELQAYREVRFPLLIERLKNSTHVSSKELRKLGKCPLTPEESALVLAGLGFKRESYIYLAGSAIYGGQSRMQSLTTLYPNLITKEDLLQPSELAPFKNFSSQLIKIKYIQFEFEATQCNTGLPKHSIVPAMTKLRCMLAKSGLIKRKLEANTRINPHPKKDPSTILLVWGSKTIFGLEGFGLVLDPEDLVGLDPRVVRVHNLKIQF